MARWSRAAIAPPSVFSLLASKKEVVLDDFARVPLHPFGDCGPWRPSQSSLLSLVPLSGAFSLVCFACRLSCADGRPPTGNKAPARVCGSVYSAGHDADACAPDRNSTPTILCVPAVCRWAS
nr:hypothetical protein [Pandoravirus massiliensis]